MFTCISAMAVPVWPSCCRGQQLCFNYNGRIDLNGLYSNAYMLLSLSSSNDEHGGLKSSSSFINDAPYGFEIFPYAISIRKNACDICQNFGSRCDLRQSPYPTASDQIKPVDLRDEGLLSQLEPRTMLVVVCTSS